MQWTGKNLKYFLRVCLRRRVIESSAHPTIMTSGPNLIITNTSGKGQQFKQNDIKAMWVNLLCKKYMLRNFIISVIPLLLLQIQSMNPTQLAQSCNISLWDREKLIQEIKFAEKYQIEQSY